MTIDDAKAHVIARLRGEPAKTDTPMIVRIEIPGLPPTVNGRKMLINGRPMNRTAVRAFQAAATGCGILAMRRAGLLRPLAVPVVALVTYRVSPARRRDNDASIKDVFDGLEGAVWTNDRLVVRHTPRSVPAAARAAFGGDWTHDECTIVHVAEAGADPDAAMASLLLAGLS